MHIPRFKLYRMGSDPEALFVRPVDFDWIITPAYDIIGKDKKKTTSSFIGTDSRPVVVEIRPNPSRNLKRHLYELAYAVVSIQDYLDKSPKWQGTYLLAYPHLLHENLGGHIHASMFTDDPLYVKLQAHGYTVGTGNPILAASGGGQLDRRNRDLEHEVVHAIRENSIVTPQEWGRAMGFLLTPFEKMIQPWVARETRNTHYGAEMGPDCVRLGVSPPPFPGWAYVHWEYRMPSTWLHHPWLAYAYLGLAKFVVLNMQRVFEHWLAEQLVEKKRKQPVAEEATPLDESIPDGNPTHFTQLAVGDPREAQAIFYRNFRRVLVGARLSRDLVNLPSVIDKCAQQRAVWFSKPTPIDISAWRRLL